MPVNDTTANRGYQKPNIANTLADDVGRLRSALDNIDTDMASKAPTASPTFTGTAGIPAGSATGPSLYFTGDDNTGLYSPGADQVAISTGGTERLRLTSAGNVGIGTSSPGQALDVVGIVNSQGNATTLVHYQAQDTGAAANENTWRIAQTFRTPKSLALGVTVNDAGSTAYAPITIVRSGVSLDNIQFATGTGIERVRIDSSGRLLAGASTSADLGSLIQTAQTTGTGAFEAFQFSNNTAYPFITFAKSRGASVGTNTIVQNGDPLGEIIFRGADGTDYDTAASITAFVDGEPGTAGDATDMPGRLVFSTTADGASSPTERLRIDNAGTTTLTSAASTAPFIAKINTSEVARIDSSGRLLVGTSTSRSVLAVVAALQVEGTSFSGGSMQLATNTNDAQSSYFTFVKSRGTALGSNIVVQNADNLGQIRFCGADGGAIISGAQIKAEVDGTPGADDMPGRLVFSTTADGAASPTERMRIASDGRHIINSNAHSGTALSTTAPAKLYTSTGTYTDTSTAASGTVTHGTIVAFDNPAIAATNATVTYTNASTVYIDGAPTNGTNVTITNGFALFVAAGASRFGGSVLSSSATAGIGYATGAGGAQTQTTSRTQGVTLNTICGAITLFSAAGSTTWQSFTVTNSTVAATDTVIVNQKSGTDLYMIHVTNVAAGSFRITYATTGGTTTEQPVFNFSVIKAVAA